MSTELTVGRMLNVYFGTALMVWAFVLGVTMLFLALGYFLGNYLASRLRNLFKTLEILLVVLFFAMLVASVYQSICRQAILHFDFYFALSFSSLLLIGLPALCCGAITPVLIQLFNSDLQTSENVSGKVLGLSTIGGVCAIFLCAFYFMSSFGLSNTALISAVLVLMLLVIILYKRRALVFLFILILFLGLIFYRNTKHSALYMNEGINGRIEVVDEASANGEKIRSLKVNQIVQTQWNLTQDESVTPYITKITQRLDSQITDGFGTKNVLILGFGGGALGKTLFAKAYVVHGVELDKRIVDVAHFFFNTPNEIKIFNTDARLFINTCSEKYAAIILDVFKGENLPFNLFTIEALQSVKRCMKPNALLIINTNGYVDEEKGKANLAILETLKACGFSADYELTNKVPAYANAIITASLNSNYANSIIDEKLILTDDRGDLDLLNANAAFEWRKNYLKALY